MRLITIAPMTRVTSLFRTRAPLGGQEIELQQIDFEAGGAGAHGRSEAHAPERDPRAGIPISLLRTRIRENSRFTVFDIDPQTAQAWGQALLEWARGQPT
jgi:hypothetical protein